MVIQKNNLYACEACGFTYKEEEWAEQCEAWCTRHKSCNSKITARAINPKNTDVKGGRT